MAQKNYFAHGGSELVIGGKLTFLPGASVEGAEGLLDVPGEATVEGELPFLPDSTATTIAGLRSDFNSLLTSLRELGVLAHAAGGESTEAAYVPDT